MGTSFCTSYSTIHGIYQKLTTLERCTHCYALQITTFHKLANTLSHFSANPKYIKGAKSELHSGKLMKGYKVQRRLSGSISLELFMGFTVALIYLVPKRHQWCLKTCDIYSMLHKYSILKYLGVEPADS